MTPLSKIIDMENYNDILKRKKRIMVRAEKIIDTSKLLIDVCENWISNEEGDKNMIKDILKRKNAENENAEGKKCEKTKMGKVKWLNQKNLKEKLQLLKNPKQRAKISRLWKWIGKNYEL